MEDFFGIFRYVGESIPEELYSDLDEFVDKSHAWKVLHDDDGDEQVKAAVEKEWDNVELDKKRLIEENMDRKHRFLQDLSYLQKTPIKTEWEKILSLYAKMMQELTVNK